MDVEALRKLCLSFPGVTEQIQWGDDLLFKVGGKMFVVTPLEPAPVCLSFKATPEAFVELTERPGVIPAPYLARAKWVALESRDAISSTELADLLRVSYELVAAKLPAKIRESLSKSKFTGVRNPRRKTKSRKAPVKKTHRQ
jgi:predicted DNA-binding protein (MmcQ/YjbR family)